MGLETALLILAKLILISCIIGLITAVGCLIFGLIVFLLNQAPTLDELCNKMDADNEHPDMLNKWTKEAMEEHKSGNLKTYTDYEDMMKDIDTEERVVSIGEIFAEVGEIGEITTEKEYYAVLKRIDFLLECPAIRHAVHKVELTDEGKELDRLVTLVEEYEEREEKVGYIL